MFVESSVGLHRCASTSRYCRRKKVIVPKFLVPDNATLAASASVEERFVDGPTQGARIFVRESTSGGLAPRKMLFAEAMLENSATKPRRRLSDFVVSAAVELLLLAKPRVMSVVGKLVMPRAIPHQVARLTEQVDGNDATAEIVPGDGVPDGVPGGQPGGVIGGVLSGAAPPAPSAINSAPRRPIRVGQGVKAPRLILGPQPVYPVLARQAKISGAVVIDAVIDTQGNIVEMRTVSGHPILALAAMEALRHWKYEPTILGGEAFPVELLVTITFAPKGAQG